MVRYDIDEDGNPIEHEDAFHEGDFDDFDR